MLASIFSEFVKAPPGANDALLNQCVEAYAGAGVFQGSAQPWVEDNPFRRQLLNESFRDFDTETPLALDNLRTNASLVANRILMSIYERDFVFLPAHNLEDKWSDFQAYYGDELRLLGEVIRSQLERYVFSSVEREVSISGPWTIEAFEAYFDDFRRNFTAEGNAKLMMAITSARNPVAAAQTYLIQLAGDFLVESSAMARNAIGNYGPLQSELFKVIIDECGYGVHSTRHSTLYQKVLESRGFDPVPHTYWQFYLPSSFYLNNYYSYICRDHRHLFRYFGAILQVETAFRLSCRQMADMMNNVFGPSAETDYFLEHVHIDTHHSRMVLENLIVPAVKTYGNSILADIIRGFEESLIVGSVFCEGTGAQIAWGDSLSATPGDQSREESGPLRVTSFIELAGDRRWNGTRVSDVDTTFLVKSGELDLVAGYGIVATYGAGQALTVPAGMLYAVCPSSDCAYETAGGEG
ncbi:MAG TPA: iron-containing redox enzyme family protein [Blastocatellia bacterium]